MEPDDYRIEMMGYLDGELDENRRRRFERKLAEDPSLAAELARFRRIADLTDAVEFEEPTDLEWQDFWNGLYNRLERRTGWIFVIVGTLLVTAYGIREVILTPEIRPLLKAGILSTLAGFSLLQASVWRSKRRLADVDRYRKVRR